MKSLILLVSFALINFVSLASSKRLIGPYYVKKDSLTKELGPNKAIFKIHIRNWDDYEPYLYKEVQTKVNGVWKTYVCSPKNEIEIAVQPGSHNIEFFLNAIYVSVNMQNHPIEAAHTQWIEMNFQKKNPFEEIDEPQPIMVYKPVIYTYGNEQSFSIKVKPTGDFTFTYPNYTDAWSGIAHEDGSITMEGKNYPYLFWESNQTYQFSATTNGYKVNRTEVISFLESRLKELGFTTKEQTDFITFWGPKLVQNETSFVQFELGEACNQFATLECSPAPSHINRVYISFCKWEENMENYVNPVALEHLTRDGFTLLEWGGFSFIAPTTNLAKNQ
jgi:hypothetical protein